MVYVFDAPLHMLLAHNPQLHCLLPVAVTQALSAWWSSFERCIRILCRPEVHNAIELFSLAAQSRQQSRIEISSKIRTNRKQTYTQTHS